MSISPPALDATRIANGRAYRIFALDGRIRIWSRPINPKTGKPWQAYRCVAEFAAHDFPQALRAWLYAGRKA
jgi:hypothetical protein